MNQTTRRRWTVLTAATLLLALLPPSLAACSSGPGTPRQTDTASGVGATWGSCMRERGFTVQDPDDATVTSGAYRIPPGVDEDEFVAAAGRCRTRAGVEGTSSADRQEWARQYQAVAACIRDNGYEDFPEQENGSISTEGYARATEEAFEAVFDDCMRKHSPDTKVQDVG